MTTRWTDGCIRAMWQNPIPACDKSSQQTGTEGLSSFLIKGIYEKNIVNTNT